MAQAFRFGAFLREISVRQRQISMNDLAAESSRAQTGARQPDHLPQLRVRPIDIYRLLGPYTNVRLQEQLRAVVPLAVYLALFQFFILEQPISESWTISAGLLSVIVGLMLFLEGLKVGLMPLGETLGHTLPSRSPLPLVLTIALILGVGVTFAEPAIGALKAAGAIVSAETAPYLYALLTEWSDMLVLAVGSGVGLAAVLGTVRFLYGWSLKPLIYLALVPALGLTIHIALHPELSKLLGLAWDCGAVTTGPVTVPLVLSLGIGIAAAASKDGSSLSGFGIVTLASLFPIIAVMLLGLYVAGTTTPAEIIAMAARAGTDAGAVRWYQATPGAEIIAGLRAIVPLLLFLFLVMKLVLGENIRNPGIIAYGIVLCVLGIILFNLGLTYGLAKLGSQSGVLIPAAFARIASVDNSPLYTFFIGLGITLLFAWVLGAGATLAEPALNALGVTVENLTNGAFRKSLLMYVVSVGVGCGIVIGISKIIFNLPLVWLILPGYAVALLLTLISSEELVNVAWDSAGVTTGPVTVPLVLALGLGCGTAVGATEGFGILSLASIGPIISVQATGLWIRWKNRNPQLAPEITPLSADP